MPFIVFLVNYLHNKAISLSDDELDEVFGILRGGVPTQTSFRNATILKLAHQGKTPTEIAKEL